DPAVVALVERAPLEREELGLRGALGAARVHERRERRLTSPRKHATFRAARRHLPLFFARQALVLGLAERTRLLPRDAVHRVRRSIGLSFVAEAVPHSVVVALDAAPVHGLARVRALAVLRARVVLRDRDLREVHAERVQLDVVDGPLVALAVCAAHRELAAR